MRRGHGLVDHRRPRECPRDDRDEVEPDRHDEPLPLDRPERVADLAPVRPAEVDRSARRNERADNRTDPHPTVPRQGAQESPHAVTAGRPARSTTSRYTSASRSAIESHA
jgi:hypothetical protein